MGVESARSEYGFEEESGGDGAVRYYGEKESTENDVEMRDGNVGDVASSGFAAWLDGGLAVTLGLVILSPVGLLLLGLEGMAGRQKEEDMDDGLNDARERGANQEQFDADGTGDHDVEEDG